jgi:uncharacterized membrane protein
VYETQIWIQNSALKHKYINYIESIAQNTEQFSYQSTHQQQLKITPKQKQDAELLNITTTDSKKD